MKNQTKKNVRRMLSILLTLIMCFSLTCPVFAADEMDGSPGTDAAEIILQTDEQEFETGDVETTENETGTKVEEQPETNGETGGTVETATSSNAGESGQADGNETGNTNDEEQVKEEEIPAVIQEFLKAVDAVLNFGDVTEENAEEYHALYEAAMTAYEAVQAEQLESDERVEKAMEQLVAKGDVQPKDNSTDASEDDGTDQQKGDDSGNDEGDEQRKEAVIQDFLDAVAKVKELDEVTEDDPLYQAAMDAYKAVEAEGLETDERVKAAMETLEGLVKKAEENSNVFEVSTLKEFLDAIATIDSYDGGSYTINLTNDIEIVYGTSHWDLDFTKGETVTISGNGHTITLLTNSSNTFRVANRSVLNLENVTVKGNGQQGSLAMFDVAGNATLNMYDNVTLKDFKAYGATGGGSAVSVQNGTFNMYGGTISNCYVNMNPFGGAITIQDGTFNMSGGVITNCGFTDGKIGYGGGVFLTNSTFHMSGNSVIRGCKATYGGGVVVDDDCEFIMSDGATIQNCEATKQGGGIYSFGTTTATAVYNNTAGEVGDDIWVENSSNLTLSPVGSNWTLNETGKTITSWYYDGYRETDGTVDKTRWTVSDAEEECYLYEYSTPANNVEVALKAAHGMAEKVTVTYIADDNVIGEETQVKGSSFTIRDALESTTADKEFDYWSGDDGKTYEPGATITPEANLVLTAVMKDKTADYTVEWYDVDGNSIKEADTRSATVGTEVTVTEDDETAVEGYTFKAENPNNVLKATVAGDSSTVLKLYFTKDPVPTTYTVMWCDADGKAIKETEKRDATVGETVSVKDADKTVEGYTFDGKNGNNVLEATVAENGVTTLKLYFTKNPIKTTYKVEWYDADGKAIKEAVERDATVGETVSVKDADKTVEGYTFDGKNGNNVLEATVAENGVTTLKLYFTKNPIKTTYKVEWYDADGKAIKEAVERDATVGETVSVKDADKTVEGYTFDKNNANNVLKATVAENGTTTLKLYFTKKSTTPVGPVDPEPKDVTYKVEWYDVDGNSIKATDTRSAKAGTTVSVKEADKVVEGYTFDANNKNNILTAVVAEDGSTVLKLYFTKNSTGPVGPVNPEPKDTTYKVEWYDVDGNKIKATETRSAKAGTTVSVKEADKVVEGYTFDANNKNNILTAVVAEDGSTVLKLYFTKNSTGPVGPVNPDKPKNTTYKVEWYNVDGDKIKATETRSAKAGTKVSVTEADKVVEGYTFDKDNANNILTAVVAEDGSTVLKLYFTKNSTPPTGPDKPENPETPKDTTYKVEWYNVDGNIIKATETRSAKAGTKVSVTEADKVVAGYTFDKDNANNILTAVVAEDGSTVLKLYFTKNSTPPTGPDKPENPETPKDTTYKVEWYDVDGNSIKTTEVRSAKAGTTVSVTEADKVVEGYTFDKDNANNILTAVVAEDGSTVLKLYFTKNSTPPTGPDKPENPETPKDTTYKVEWYDVDGNSIKTTEVRSAKAGTTVSVTEADKVVEGYTFDANNKNNILTAVVAEDGSTVLKLYFTKNSSGPDNNDTTPPTTPTEDTTPSNPNRDIPKTGDTTSNWALYLMLASGLALIVLLFVKRKEDK